MAQVPGAPTGPPPAAHVQLVRHHDGRHAVLDGQGNILGLHNSLQSAQRQMGDYYEPQGSAGIPQNTFQPPTPGNPQGPGGNPQAPGFQAPQAPVAVQQAAFQEALPAPAQPVGSPQGFQEPLPGGWMQGAAAAHQGAVPMGPIQGGLPALKPNAAQIMQGRMQAMQDAQQRMAMQQAQQRRGAQGMPNGPIHG